MGVPGGGFGSPPQGGSGGFGPPPLPPDVFVPPPSGPVLQAGPPEHEFGQNEEEVIRKTSYWAKALAIALFVYGALSIVNCNIIYVLGYVAIGVPLLMAGNALSKVSDTRGRDITNMMQAIDALGTSFLVRIIVMLIMVVLSILLVLFVILFMGVLAAIIAGNSTV